MAELHFTPQLRRFTAAPQLHCEAATLSEALAAAFAVNPRLRGYLLDDQGGLRPNVAVFVDGQQLVDRAAQSDAVGPGSEIYVMQALSGG